MNRLFRCAAAMVSGVFLLSTADAATWLTDFEAAKSQAASTQRPILINFTGSDWCPACMRLRRQVLEQPDFLSYADGNLVLLEIDFPRTRPQGASVREGNQRLAQQFGVTHFPSLFLTDSSGRPTKRISGGGSSSEFVQMLRQWTTQTALRPPDRTGPERGAAAPRKEVPLFGGAPTQAPIVYTNLVLKSITGNRSRRFALINSQTLAAGESATVNLGKEKVTVHCMEIRDRSVLVKITGDNSPRELQLANIH